MAKTIFNMADGILTPAMWQVALGCHAIEFAILEFYFWF